MESRNRREESRIATEKEDSMNIREKTGFVCEEDYPVVATTEGKLRGFVDGDVFCFRGA